MTLQFSHCVTCFLLFVCCSYDWYQNDKIVTISVFTRKKVCFDILLNLS